MARKPILTGTWDERQVTGEGPYKLSGAHKPLTPLEQEALDYNFFADDKDCSGIRNHTAKIVTSRVEHTCSFSPLTHTIPSGSRVRVDKAIVDGAWSVFYSCMKCHEMERRTLNENKDSE